MTLNYFPINFPFHEYQVTRVEYSDSYLAELRSKHNTTHSFFRHEEHIYISNKSGEDLGIGETVTVNLDDDKISSSMIRHLFFKTFLENYPTYKLSGFYPFRLPATRENLDLMAPLLPDNLKGKIKYTPQIEAQLRRVNINGEVKYGFLVNLDRFFKFNITLKELVDEGFGVVDKEVIYSQSLEGLDEIMLPDESFVGVLKSIKDGIGTVETNEGDKEYSLDQLLLRKTQTNIRDYLAYKLGDKLKADAILTKLKKARKTIQRPEKKLNSIKYASNILFKLKNVNVKYENKDGFCFTVETNGNHNYQSFELTEAVYVFDPSATRTDKFNDRGLTNYGPYDKGTFDIKSPKIIAICHKNNRGAMSTFLGALITGLPNSKYFIKGLKSKYELNDVDIEILEIEDFHIDNVRDAISSLPSMPQLIIFEIPQSFKSERIIQKSLYYLSKAHILNLQIPLQIVSSENIKNHDEYKLNAIALQCYAKLGGVPWTIKTTQSLDHEIIIGIGHSIFRSNSYSGNLQDRVVGISTFFSGDGQYLMSGDIKDVTYEKYFDELLKSLKESLITLSSTYAWKQNSTVRLVFHIFKPLKNIEFDVVKELIKEFSQFQIQFAFVTISSRHPYQMYDLTQYGIKNRYNASVKGKYVPSRGKNIVLNDSSCLIQMLGAKEIKSDAHGASHPLLIRILKPTNYRVDDDLVNFLFHDLNYITQQIYRFSSLSWRGFFPNQKPATMLYSVLISRLLGNLRKIDGWNSTVINLQLKRKKWFL